MKVTIIKPNFDNQSVELLYKGEISVPPLDPGTPDLETLLHCVKTYPKIILAWEELASKCEALYRKERNFKKSRRYQDKAKRGRAGVNRVSRRLDKARAQLRQHIWVES